MSKGMFNSLSFCNCHNYQDWTVSKGMYYANICLPIPYDFYFIEFEYILPSVNSLHSCYPPKLRPFLRNSWPAKSLSLKKLPYFRTNIGITCPWSSVILCDFLLRVWIPHWFKWDSHNLSTFLVFFLTHSRQCDPFCHQ